MNAAARRPYTTADRPAGTSNWPLLVRLFAGGCGLAAMVLVAGTVPAWVRWWFVLATTAAIVLGMIRRELAVAEPVGFVLLVAGSTVGAMFGGFSVWHGIVVGLLLLTYALLVELADELFGASTTRSIEVADWVGAVAPLLGVGTLAGLVVGGVLIVLLPPVMTIVVLSPLLVLAAAAVAFGRRFVRS